ncbi:MAG: PAS domain S-box protein [Acidobacteriota bacterium]
MNLRGTITSWNKSAERLFGHTAEEAIGKPITILIPSDRLSEEPQILEKIRHGGRVEHFETVRKSKSGALLQIELTISPIVDSKGVVVGASKIAHDIGDRVRYEKARTLLSAIVDSSEDAIISKDLNGIITSWNVGAERLFGYQEAEAIGQPVTILIPPNHLDEEPEIIARIRAGERVDHFETVRRAKTGELLDISLTISPIRDAKGRVVGASKIARDIRERKRIDTDIRRANRDLEQFAFSASHDLQEPLRTIVNYSQLLERQFKSTLDPTAVRYLGHIESGAIRMDRLIRDLLAYTQVSTAQEPEGLVNANIAFAKAMENLEISVGEGPVKVTRGELHDVSLSETHLVQLFQNLLGNAFKYRVLDRVPEVHVSSAARGGFIEFSVKDNGIGIACEYTETIFDLFKRLHTNEEYAGTGIGLALCRRIVERYSGKIWVDSVAGSGSTFHFTIRS